MEFKFYNNYNIQEYYTIDDKNTNNTTLYKTSQAMCINFMSNFFLFQYYL